MKSSPALAYRNGHIISRIAEGVSIDSLAVQRGYGVFDVTAIDSGRLLYPKEHYKRLTSSAKLMNLKHGLSYNKWIHGVASLFKKSHVTHGVVRTYILGQEFHKTARFVMADVWILIDPEVIYDTSLYTRGAKVITVDYQRLYPSVKTTNYILPLSLENKKRAARAIELLYLKDKKVLECSTSNFFIVKDNTVITSSDGVLGGITRNVLIKIAGKKYSVLEKSIDVAELSNADEAFITASLKKVIPVVRIDDRNVGDGDVGLVTGELMRLYEQHAKSKSIDL